MRKYIFTIIFAAATGSLSAQNVTVIGKDGSRHEFKKEEIASIDFNAPERIPVTKPEAAEAVDLGLSVKWATCNVGATKATEVGAYFAWGEKEEKDLYNWNTYFDTDCESPLESICGMPDYDVAAAEWGGEWRMPTLAEMQELCTKCTWEWGEQDGTSGYIVKSANGQSIFLPAAGTRQGTDLYLSSTYGSYLTGTRDVTNHFYAYALVFQPNGEHWVDNNLRDYGQSIRPVHKE